MRPILIAFLLSLGSLTAISAVAQEKAPPPKTDLGFDASKVPPPDLKKGEPVARVLNGGTGEKSPNSPRRPDLSQQTTAVLQERIKSLIAALDSDTFAARQEATNQLIRIGQPAVPALQAALKSRSTETRARARLTLTALGKDPTLRSLVVGTIDGASRLQLTSAIKTVSVAEVSGHAAVLADDLDADEIVIERIGEAGKVILAGKAKRLRVGALYGKALVDTSRLEVQTLELGRVYGEAEVRVSQIENVRFLDSMKGHGFHRDGDAVVIRGLPVLREDALILGVWSTTEAANELHRIIEFVRAWIPCSEDGAELER